MAIGKPPLILDWDYIDHLLIRGYSGREIAGEIGIHPNTIYDHCLKDKGEPFGQYSLQFYSKGDGMLRGAQFDKAMSGDNSMLIWLGKNRLKQKDNHESSDKVMHVQYTPDSAAHKDGQVQSQTIPEKDSVSSQ